MIVKIQNKSITVNNCYAYRYQNGKLVLKIEIPQSSITYEELKKLITSNKSDIVLTRDDESTETFCGFYFTYSITDKDEMFIVEIECVSETERKVQDLQHIIDAQAATISALAKENEAMTLAVDDMNDTLLEMILKED